MPWCGAFVAYVCHSIGLPFPKLYAGAKSWADWGIDAGGPLHGAVAVLVRNGGGHVGIVTGTTLDAKHVRLLGGNQGDAVSEAWFPVERVIAYRLPDGEQAPPATVAALGTISQSEA